MYIWCDLLCSSFDDSHFDNGAPTLEIKNAPTIVGNTNPFIITFQFSEDVRFFELNDIEVTNGTAGNFTPISVSAATGEITLDGNGDAVISVASAAAEDFVGNLSEGV